MTSSQQSACSVELLADCKSASSNLEWDYEERPLTQVSLKLTLDQGREEYKAAAYAAPPSAENAQDLSDAAMPFPKMRRPKAPAAERPVASELRPKFALSSLDCAPQIVRGHFGKNTFLTVF